MIFIHLHLFDLQSPVYASLSNKIILLYVIDIFGHTTAMELYVF